MFKPYSMNRIKENIAHFWHFASEDIWRITETEVSGSRRILINLFKTVIISVRRFKEDDLQAKASALTYNMMLAIVPMLALMYAIARGFGFQNIIQMQLLDYFPAQRNALTYIFDFVKTYLSETRNGGVFVGAGILMLLWTDNEELAASLETLPKANVLAVSSPNQLFALSADNIFKINTARLGTDGVRIRTLKNNSVNGNKFQLNDKWTDLSGTATDPLFLVTRNGNEFLVGYNDGMLLYALRFPRNDSIWDYQGKPSKDYFSLNLEDLNFIKETVLKERPQDWERIKERLFYNKIKSPYFQ